jgi:hypothetical protein
LKDAWIVFAVCGKSLNKASSPNFLYSTETIFIGCIFGAKPLPRRQEIHRHSDPMGIAQRGIIVVDLILDKPYAFCIDWGISKYPRDKYFIVSP